MQMHDNSLVVCRRWFECHVHPAVGDDLFLSPPAVPKVEQPKARMVTRRYKQATTLQSAANKDPQHIPTAAI